MKLKRRTPLRTYWTVGTDSDGADRSLRSGFVYGTLDAACEVARSSTERYGVHWKVWRVEIMAVEEA